MSDHVDSELPELVLGLLDEQARIRIAAHLAECEACTQHQNELLDVTSALDDSLPAVSPSPELLSRITASVSGPERFAHLFARVAELFDLPEAEIRPLLARIDDPHAWEPGPGPGVKLISVNPGPRAQHALTALVRLDPGATFPMHDHFGPERVLVLEGGYRENDGTQVWRGELAYQASGTAHEFHALEGQPCVCAAVTEFATEATTPDG